MHRSARRGCGVWRWLRWGCGGRRGLWGCLRLTLSERYRLRWRSEQFAPSKPKLASQPFGLYSSGGSLADRVASEHAKNGGKLVTGVAHG